MFFFTEQNLHATFTNKTINQNSSANLRDFLKKVLKYLMILINYQIS